MIKVISILLVFLYTSVQGIGMSFNLHFCNDEITEINMLDVEADCCCAGYNDFSENCCDDEQVYAKSETEHAAANMLTLAKKTKEQVSTLVLTPQLSCLSCSQYLKKHNSNSPPNSQPQSWLLFSTLRL